MGQFVHLRLHTEYSLVDGIVRVPELMAAVAAARMPAIALTDQCNLFAMVKFYKEALAAGVKPLIGVDAWIREPGEHRAAPPFVGPGGEDGHQVVVAFIGREQRVEAARQT